MTRIHITASGKAAPCTASIRDCPRGGSDDHFDSVKEAVIAIHKREVAASEQGEDNAAPTAPAEPFADERMNKYYAEKWERLTRGASLLGLREATPGEMKEQWASFGRKNADSPYQRVFFAQEAYVHEGNLTQELVADPDWRSTLGYWEVSTEEVEAWAKHAYGGVGHHLASYAASALEMHPERTAEEVRDEALVYLIKRTSFGVRDGAEGTHMAPIPGGTRFDPDGEPLPTKHDAERKEVPVERDSRHRYGAQGEKNEEEDAGQRAKQAPEALDPAIIEALKLKYLKVFKMPFDESGHSIPELLQMAQKGELG